MKGCTLRERTSQNGFRKVGIIGLLLLFSFGLASCGSNSNSTGMGSANVTMSDPPSSTEYSNVWVTVDGVEASISTSDTGWVPLVSDLSSTSGSIKAVQLDLMNLSSSGSNANCLLAMLGSTQSLPAGNYQQIRLMLVPNSATTADVTLLSPSGEPTTNQCDGANAGGWNCAMPDGGSMQTLQLSSQAQTGLKIPPGQVLGGPISVASGTTVDINIDFNADRSIVNEAGQLRLDPVLVAYQASANDTSADSISGKVMLGQIGTNNEVKATSTAIADANVALEMPSSNPDPSNGSNVDLIGNYLEHTDSGGNFYFCPLPSIGTTFDIVASAGPVTVTSGSGSTTTTYGATIVTDVSTGTQMTAPVLLLSQTTGASTLSGNLSASAATSATAVNADIFSLQAASSSLEFAVPLLTGSNPTMAQLSLACTSGACTAPFTLLVPPSNPLIGAFSGGSITWTLPAASPYTYKVEGTCTGSPGSVFSTAQTVTGGSTTSGLDLSLGTCQ